MGRFRLALRLSGDEGVVAIARGMNMPRIVEVDGLDTGNYHVINISVMDEPSERLIEEA